MNNLRAGLLDEAVSLRFCDDKLSFFDVAVDSYFASVAADFIRHKLLASGVSFTFETVMSSADKVSFLRKAQRHGFRTYLYFVATEDPIINISRVHNRVRLGGHPVPDMSARWPCSRTPSATQTGPIFLIIPGLRKSGLRKSAVALP